MVFLNTPHNPTGTAPEARVTISYIWNDGRAMTTSSPGCRKAVPSMAMMSSDPLPRTMCSGVSFNRPASLRVSSKPLLSG